MTTFFPPQQPLETPFGKSPSPAFSSQQAKLLVFLLPLRKSLLDHFLGNPLFTLSSPQFTDSLDSVIEICSLDLPP